MNSLLDLMWEGSYGAVTIDDICKRADVKKGSFYHFFESKAALAIAALDHYWTEEWKPVLDEKFSPSVDPVQRMTGYLERAYLKQCELKVEKGKVLGCPLCSVGSEVRSQEPEVANKICQLLKLKRKYWESAIRDAMAQGEIEPGDPVEKAARLSALLEGTVTQARIMNDPEMMRHLPQIALDFLRAKSSVPAA
jgi:TetR/AcrR family transcriptional repressor of nem operon